MRYKNRPFVLSVQKAPIEYLSPYNKKLLERVLLEDLTRLPARPVRWILPFAVLHGMKFLHF